MILAVDVHYRQDHAKCVGVLFEWEDERPKHTLVAIIDEIAPYQPGKFYKRELGIIRNYDFTGKNGINGCLRNNGLIRVECV